MKQKISTQFACTPKTVVDRDIIESIPLSKECQLAFEKLSKNDPEPFQFIQEVKLGDNHPTSEGEIYTKEWGESYVAKANKKPIVGSAYGHDLDSKRRENHLYVVGAKMQDDETMLLRHYVTRDMPEYEYQKLTKELQAGLLSTSVVSLNDYEIKTNDNGQETWYAVNSAGWERNDIVEWNLTGMESRQIAVSQKSKPVDNKGTSDMKLDEAIDLVKQSCESLGVEGSRELAEKLGFQSLLKTEEMENKAKKLDDLEAKTNGLESFVEKAIEFQKESFNEAKKVAMNKAFEGNEKAIQLASDLLGDKNLSAVELENEIKRISELASMKDILSQSMDLRNQTTQTITEQKVGCFVSKEWG